MKIFIIIKHNSQRIKKKNFLNINGFPLWEFFLKKFKKKDQVYIDTDSSEVAIVGKLSSTLLASSAKDIETENTISSIVIRFIAIIFP